VKNRLVFYREGGGGGGSSILADWLRKAKPTIKHIIAKINNDLDCSKNGKL
jgi:hypothetical protein